MNFNYDEKTVCDSVMKIHGADIYELYGNGNVLGGIEFSEIYNKYFRYPRNGVDMCIQHWLECAGLDDDGNFIYKISEHIINC